MYGARLTGCPLAEYYTDPVKYCEGQSAVLEEIKPDVIFSIVSFKKNPPNISKPALNDYSEIDNLKVPDVTSDKALIYIRECVQELAKNFGQEVPIAAIATAPADLPALIMGIDAWLDTLLFHEDAATKLIDMLVPYFIDWTSILFEAGASFVVLPAAFVNPRILTEKIVESALLQIYETVFSKLKGPVVFHHGGMPLYPFISFFKNLPNVAGVVVDQRDNLIKSRELLGSEKILLGNINGPLICSYNEERIFAKTKAILENRNGDLRYIFASSSADVAYDTPLENLKAVYQAVNS
jgi:uroporphyrinogen decarboxylase